MSEPEQKLETIFEEPEPKQEAKVEEPEKQITKEQTPPKITYQTG